MHHQLPLPGTPAQLDVRAYPADPADSGLGLTGVTVPGPLGDYPTLVATYRNDPGAP